jgi:allantoinase
MIPQEAEKPNAPETYDWAIRSQRVLTPEGLRPAAVLVRGEQIAAIVAPDEVPAGCPVDDVAERVVMPGLVDTHVHINEPGRTEWEGFETATRSAAAGGITTLVDMPLNSSPVTTTPEALGLKLGAAEGKLWVDCGFYGGVVPSNGDQIEALARAGVLGFKAFLCPSGIDEFPPVKIEDLNVVMPKIAATGLPLLVHAELVRPLTLEEQAPFAFDPRSYAAYLATRPPAWEDEALRLMIPLSGAHRCRVHIVHLSSPGISFELLRVIRNALPLTVETCPHYLCFAAEEIPDGDPRFKCAPPIQGDKARKRLWQALKLGAIDLIASDHSPAPPELKHLDTGDLRRAWGGIASLQLSLSAVWTEGQKHEVTLADVAQWMCRAPAKLVGLESCKGALAPGYDADLIVFDPDAEFKVEPGMLHHRHKATPYEGRTLRGRVEKTFLRGRKIYDAGQFGDGPTGRPILRFAGHGRTHD